MNNPNCSDSQPLITAQSLSFAYQQKTVLSKVNLSIYDNEIVTLIGPNGAGKSTLLALITGLNPPQHGQIIRRADLTLGFVPQYIHRDATLPIRVREFIALARPSLPVMEQNYILQRLGVEKLTTHFVADLSGGELRRVLFARALLRNPRLLVLDEPTAGVDINGQAQFYEELSAFKKRYQFSVLLVSHDLHLVMNTTDRVICLNKHICCMGKAEQIQDDPHYLALFGNNANLALYQHEMRHHQDAHD